MAEAKKSIARVSFSITGANGSVIYGEGSTVPAEIAAKYPKFIDGYKPPKPPKHDPTLPMKLSSSMAKSWTMDRLTAWIVQYHPAKVPTTALDKTALVELVMELQGE